jgi:hypothetical protein
MQKVYKNDEVPNLIVKADEIKAMLISSLNTAKAK